MPKKYLKYNGRLYRRYAWVDQAKTAELLSTWWLRDNEKYFKVLSVPDTDEKLLAFIKKKFRDHLYELAEDAIEKGVDWDEQLPELKKMIKVPQGESE